MKMFLQILLVGVLFIALDAKPATDSRDQQIPTSPPKAESLDKAKAKPVVKRRIGYYEGGQYPDYEIILKAIVRGLIALNWM